MPNHLRIIDSFYNNLIAEDRYRMILDGLQVTLLITLGAIILGTILGGVVCWMRMSRRGWLQKTAKVYIDIMRGTPVLVILMLMYYVVMAPLEATGIVVAIITFGMNAAAYIFEAPVHSATKAFVQRIRKEVFEITGPDYDYLGMYSEMGAFCHKYNIDGKLDNAKKLCGKMLTDVMADCRPLVVRMTHSEMSGVTTLDFMVRNQQTTPLSDVQRNRLSGLCRQVVEEPTALGFRVRLII